MNTKRRWLSTTTMLTSIWLASLIVATWNMAQDNHRPAIKPKVEVASTDSAVPLAFDGTVSDKINKLQPLEPGKHTFGGFFKG